MGLHAGRRWIVCVWLCLIAPLLPAATPLMTRFSPEADIYPQYFSVARSADGLVYVGATDAVLRFDGVRWETFATPRPGPVRRLWRDRNGRLWFGGNDSFGWLERTPEGGERFVDAATAFAADIGTAGFDDIWSVLERDEGMYFRALRWLFLVDHDGRRLQAWPAPNRLGGIASHAGELLVNWRGEGIKRRVGDHFELIPGGEQFARQPAFILRSLDARRLLVYDQTPRLAVIEDGQARQLDIKEQIHNLHDAQVLDARHVAFASGDGLLRVLDIEQQRLRGIRVGTTFQNSVDLDSDGALLVVDDHGVARLPWPVAWSAYGAEDGIGGSVHDAQLLDGQLHVQSGLGELVVPWGAAGGAEGPFALRHAFPGEAWALFADGPQHILADSYGLRRLDAGASRLGPDDLYPRVFLPSRFDPARTWVGAESGVALLRKQAGSWQLAARHTGLRARSMSLVETAADELWIGSDDRGLLRLRFGADPAQPPQIQRFDAQIGAGEEPVLASEIDGRLYVSARSGLFRWDGTQFVADSVDGLATLLSAQEAVRLRAGVNGAAWAWSYRGVYQRDAARQWQRLDMIDRSAGAIETLIPLPDGDVLVGSAARLLHYDAAATIRPAAAPQLRVTAARLQPREGAARALALDGPAQIDYGAGTLLFRLGLVDLARNLPPQFQVRVAGLDEQWSEWSPRAEFSYAQIPPGDYRLEARARSAGGHQFSAPPFAFRIAPRWYQRGGVQLAGGALLCLLLAFALSLTLRARIRRLDARNRQLHALVRAHTADLETANAQLRDLAERDGLTGVANRRRCDAFLAASLAAAARSGKPVAVLLADVDHFKAYNDAHGHLAGDEVLKCVATALSQGVRDNTLVARFGGEEFCLIVPHCDLAGAGELGRRLCALVAQSCAVTISIGAAASGADSTASGAGLLARADVALYRAKGNGRNCVELDAS
jgi:diguanylate cyclase (GGDEF)-like protein